MRLSYNASKMDLQQQKDNITLQVINAYLTVLSNQEALEIAIKQASVDSAQVARLDIQNQQGAIPPATLYDLRGQYASDLVSVVNSVNALETSKVNLFALLNVSYQRDATFEMVNMNADISDLNNSSDSIYQVALQTIPTIKANDLKGSVLSKEHCCYERKTLANTLFIWKSQFQLYQYCDQYDSQVVCRQLEIREICYCRPEYL